MKDQTETCTHHWRIEEPRGGMSMGLCVKCGIYKEFKNSLAWSKDQMRAYMWQEIQSYV